MLQGEQAFVFARDEVGGGEVGSHLRGCSRHGGAVGLRAAGQTTMSLSTMLKKT